MNIEGVSPTCSGTGVPTSGNTVHQLKKKTCRRQAVIYRVVQSVAGCVVGVNCVLKRAECTGLKLIMVKILLKHILHVYLSN
jgi:hypothetical protein